MATTVRHDAANGRYLLEQDSKLVGKLEYEESDQAITITHTEVDKELQGEGLGYVLVRGAVADIPAWTRKPVIPVCPFVKKYIDDNPQEAGILKPRSN